MCHNQSEVEATDRYYALGRLFNFVGFTSFFFTGLFFSNMSLLGFIVLIVLG